MEDKDKDKHNHKDDKGISEWGLDSYSIFTKNVINQSFFLLGTLNFTWEKIFDTSIHRGCSN